MVAKVTIEESMRKGFSFKTKRPQSFTLDGKHMPIDIGQGGIVNVRDSEKETVVTLDQISHPNHGSGRLGEATLTQKGETDETDRGNIVIDGYHINVSVERL